MKITMFCLCLLPFLVCPVLAQINFTPIVQTKTGPVRGEILTYSNVTVHRYQGIPYAKPPLGELRFARPQPVSPWTDTLDAVQYRNRCILDKSFDALFYGERELPPTNEDCLHLLIVTPEHKKDGKK